MIGLLGLGNYDQKEETLYGIPNRNLKNDVSEIKISFTKSKRFKEFQIKQSSNVAEFFKSRFKRSTIELKEYVYCLYLNTKNEVIGFQKISDGALSSAVVDKQLIYATALKARASSIILCHNHPSGALKPSQADISLTKVLKNGCNLLEIKVLDHIIVTKKGHFSFADEGIL